MNTQHTPGPWRIGDHGETRGGTRTILGAADLMKVATVESYPSTTVGKADAQLIAAAPELLEACQEALQEMRAFRKYWTSPNMGLKRGVARAEELAVAAIAKALGQQIPAPKVSANLNQPI